MVELNPNSLNVTQPISVWHKNIEISFTDLFTNIGKIAIKGVTLDLAGAGETLLDTANVAGVSRDPGEVAWLLISRALCSSMASLVHEYRDLFEKPPSEEAVKEISKTFDKQISKLETTIDLNFINNPSELELLEEVKTPFREWLIQLGTSDRNADIISNRLSTYFVFALNDKWRAEPEEYTILKDFFDTPFTKASEKEYAWELYGQWLEKQITDRMFAESFGVKEVYVPLRAYCEEIDDDCDFDCILDKDSKSNFVFDLETDFFQWVNNFSKVTAVRIISGGPGSGKSTFAKIFSSRIANETNIPAIYVPLHLFDATEDLIIAMEKFIKITKFLSGNPIDINNGKPRLLIVFDGLDELALRGKAASEVANAFVDEVLRSIDHLNNQGLKYQVIITGRPIAIDSVITKLRKPKQLNHVLPYFVKDKNNYIDTEKLLDIDQRNAWWERYGKASGKNYEKMPEELSKETLDEITAQPLLNYLIALSYDSKQIEIFDDTTLNQIYSALIREVYQRQYEGGRKDIYVGNLKEDQFVRVLEEIAIAMWHGQERVASVSKIVEKCKSGGVEEYLKLFQEGAKSGVTRLLTAFYFRKSGNQNDGDPTFEFTHKSFGEYLTAKRIFRALKHIKKQLERKEKDPDDGWTKKGALENWSEFCCSVPIDKDLLRFIDNEFGVINIVELEKWQKNICDLLSYTINHGFSFSQIYGSCRFREHLKLARNAEESLIAIHSLIAKKTCVISDLNLNNKISFGEWLVRSRGQRIGPENNIIMDSLNSLNIGSSCLDIQDFWAANLNSSNLQKTNFRYATLSEANLSDTDFRYSDLGLANLERANLKRANFEGCKMVKANISSAHLEDINLKNAKLGGAILDRSKLNRAEITGANLSGASFIEADLKDANLSGTDLRRTNFFKADLSGANLLGANLSEANLKGAKTNGTLWD